MDLSQNSRPKGRIFRENGDIQYTHDKVYHNTTVISRTFENTSQLLLGSAVINLVSLYTELFIDSDY